MANKNREFFGFFEKIFLNVDFAQFYYLNESNRLIISTDWRKRMSSLSSWKFHYPTIIGRWENSECNSQHFWVFRKNFLNVDFAQFFYLNDIEPAHN